VMVDVDAFKKFNDFYGHVAGDRCLQQVALALRPAAARPQDFIARYGGEEIVLLLPETELAGATLVAEAACNAVAELGIPHAASPLGKVTISVGVASGVPDYSDSPYTLVEAADAALYDAKRCGKNRVSSDPSVFGALN
jgi:diguanylate cyclase (GGDEF)-like protein